MSYKADVSSVSPSSERIIINMIWLEACVLHFGAKATARTPPVPSVSYKVFHLNLGLAPLLNSPLYRDGHIMEVSVRRLSAVPSRC